METKFTPGPWSWLGDDYRGGWGWQVLVGPNNEGLLCGEKNGGPYENLKAHQPIEPKFCREAPGVHVLEANAHLIAAAPELYEALMLANDMLIANDCLGQKTADVINAALAKARGE